MITSWITRGAALPASRWRFDIYAQNYRPRRFLPGLAAGADPFRGGGHAARPAGPRGPVRPSFARPQLENRVHDAGKLWMNIVNRGYFGNNGYSEADALDDPCPPGNWAPQAEFPGGTGQQYLYQAGLWIGALIVEEGFETKRVSTATDGWAGSQSGGGPINEFWPGEGANGIIERSTRPGNTNCLGDYVSSPEAVSDQDFLCIYTDTLTDQS